MTNRLYGSTPAMIVLLATWEKPSRMVPISVPIQVDIRAIPATGAAVASTIKENLAREIFILSIRGLMTGPTISEFA
ncbi:hypothetical protein SDC9_163946 [bioreactor metagenome]|uniref:Uncharacterized protein n=1 Tax=bioreactor metagenome TaxID=1076179 RepID=A0A645FQB3_9ZZZZ